MPNFYIKDSGEWRKTAEFYVNSGGTWRRGKEFWVKRNGVWRLVFRRALQLSIDADTTDYDLFTAAGSPGSPVDVVLTVGLGVVVSSTSISNPAISCSASFPAGSNLLIINKGKIYGINGAGGSGAIGDAGAGSAPSSEGGAGSQGGTALEITCSTIIDNLSGQIFGGGGGGGGGGGYVDQWRTDRWNITGGGGGGGNPGGTVYDSFSEVKPTAGSSAEIESCSGGSGGYMIDRFGQAYEVGGSGGACNGPGFAGSAGQSSNESTGGAGGAVGRAVDRNGYSLTFISGENAEQLKGAYD
jgi:hypothetical protein